MAGEARVKVSLKEGVFELEGSQDFVERQLEAFGDLIRTSVQDPRRAGQEHSKGGPDEKLVSCGVGQDEQKKLDENPYPEVFAIKDKKVQLLVDHLPGDTDKGKTVNAALLSALGHEIAGMTVVPFESVREICKKHGCLNGTNFAKYLTEEERLFLFEGTPKKRTAQLTVPGRVEARKLAEALARPEEATA